MPVQLNRNEANAPRGDIVLGRFEGEAPISIALKHLNELPVPPGQLRPGIPPAIEAVVLRSLEKDPARRYETRCLMPRIEARLLGRLRREGVEVVLG